MLKIIRIKETCRNRKKSTTGTTTEGTLVTLLNSDYWDINPESSDDRLDDRATTDRRPTDDEQERIRKKKKEEEKEKKIKKEKSSDPEIEKVKFRDFVSMTQIQYDALLSKHGKEFLDAMLDVLNSYKGRSGKEYTINEYF